MEYATGSYTVFTHGGSKKTSYDAMELAVKMERMGAGELMINSIDLDGTMRGYDITLIRKISDAVRIPVITRGGAGKINDFKKVVDEGHASAVPAGSMFVYHDQCSAVLNNYLMREELESVNWGALV